MSTQTDEPDVEEVEPIEGDDHDGDGADGTQDEPEQSARKAAAAEGSSDIAKQLEKAVNDQRKRLSRILDVDLAGHECQRCDGMGYVTGPAEEEPEPVHPENLVGCTACNAYGFVVTGSRNPDHITAMCVECAGNGFITKPKELAAVVPYTPPPMTPQQAQYGQLLPDGRFLPAGATEPLIVQQPYSG